MRGRKGKRMEERYYLREKESVMEELNTSLNGLSSEEAEKRLQENGKNKLAEAKVSPL
jgi:Ca2+-transporting ATPase